MEKNIQYTAKDFNSLKSKLIEFAKIYYPTTYTDFSENSPGMMLIEIAAYVGDILSLYQETQIQENFLQFSKQRKNLLAQSYLYNYTPKVTSTSNVLVDVYQLLPSKNISGSFEPDFNYALIIDEGTQLQSSQSNIKFILEEKIDFSLSSSLDTTELSVYSLNNLNPEYYLLKKQRKAYSAEIKEITFDITNTERFKTLNISDEKIIKILDIIDSDNNKWYEVPYLAQDTIFEKELNQQSSLTSYILKLKKVPRRFISRFKSDTNLEIQFGAGISSNPDEEIIPNSENIGLGLSYGVNKLDVAYDPSNFLYTNTYGISPSNTTLTVRYLVGGGIESNIQSNTLNTVLNINTSFKGEVDSIISNTIINSLSFNNETPAIGGGNGDSNDDLKLKSLSSFPTQNRAVSIPDYIIRSLSLPSDFGLISKVYIIKDDTDTNLLSFYILSKNNLGNLSSADIMLKNNLKTYLNEYKMETDAINIKDAFIINIGVNFDIIVRPNYNNKLVLNNCIEKLQEFFNIDKWSINQPIILSDIYLLLDKIDGVQTVKNIEIINKVGEENGYSKFEYDIKSATLNNIIYPSMDPSIFEIRNINDIQGRIVSF